MSSPPAIEMSSWNRGATAVVPMPKFLWMSEVTAHAAGGWKEHRHEHYELIACTHGTYHSRLNGQDLALTSGQVLVVKPGDWHADLLRPPCRYVAVNLALPGVGPASPMIFHAEVGVEDQIQRRADPGFFLILEHLRSACSTRPGAAVQDAIMAEGWRLLLAAMPPRVLAPAFVPRRRDADFSQRLEAVFAQVHRDPPGVPALAEAMGLGVAAFVNRCRLATGLTPAKALTRFRLERALERIQLGDASVQQVAEDLGFASPFHFSRAFKRCFGVAPSRLGLIPSG